MGLSLGQDFRSLQFAYNQEKTKDNVIQVKSLANCLSEITSEEKKWKQSCKKETRDTRREQIEF